MEATGGKRVSQRVDLPVTNEQEVIDLSVKLLAARTAAAFGKGFRLRAVGRQLYVQLAGRRVPLYLDFEADPVVVQERALALRQFRREQGNDFSADAWRDLCGYQRVRTGKTKVGPQVAREAALGLDDICSLWSRFKLAQGVKTATIERKYLPQIRRLDPLRPFSEGSLLRVIEATDPLSPNRRRTVSFLRQLCKICGQQWNGTLLDPLQNAGMAVQHREQPFFSDAEIEAIVGAGLSGPWQRVVVLLAVYGLRPWEAWLAEPSSKRGDCVWVPAGKTNRHGTTRPRQVPPFHPEWFERFRVKRLLLDEPLPLLKNPGQAGSRVNQHLRRHGLLSSKGQTSYGFRHAYARRLHSPRYRVTDAHASLFMGHTVAAHHKAYRSWLGSEDPIGVYLPCEVD